MKEKIIITSYKLYKKEEKDLQKNIKKKQPTHTYQLTFHFLVPPMYFPSRPCISESCFIHFLSFLARVHSSNISALGFQVSFQPCCQSCLLFQPIPFSSSIVMDQDPSRLCHWPVPQELIFHFRLDFPFYLCHLYYLDLHCQCVVGNILV